MRGFSIERQSIIGEVRVQLEGSFRAVQGSGSGRTWATGATPPSALLGYVQSFTFTSALTITTIAERGRADHHKVTQIAPIDLTVSYLWTGAVSGVLTASGTTVPFAHLEYRASASEIAPTGYYYQFYGAALQSIQFTEQAEGNTINVQYRCLGMSGANTSGYLS